MNEKKVTGDARGDLAYAPDPTVGPDPAQSRPNPAVGPDQRRGYAELLKMWLELESKISGAPEDSGLLVEAVGLLKQLGRYDEALAVGAKALRLRPKDAYLHFLRAELYAGLGEVDAAQAELRAAVAASASAVMREQAVQLCLQMAAFDAALEWSLQNAAEPEAGAGAHRLAARLLLYWGRATDARKAAEAALKLEDEAEGRVLAGAAWTLAGRPDKGLPFLKAAAASSPKNAEAAAWHAEALRLAGKEKQALAECDRAKGLASRPVGALLNKALILLKNNKPIPPAEMPIVMTNVPMPLYDLRVRYEGNTQKWIEGIEHTLKLMAGNRSGNVTYLHKVRGKQRLVNHIHYFPRDPLVEIQSRLRFGDYKRVLKQFDAAHKEEPKEAYIHSHRGEVRLWVGDYKGAGDDFKAAGKLNSGLLWPKVGLTAVGIFTGRSAEAKQTLRVLGESGGSNSILLPWRLEAHRLSGEYEAVLKFIARDFAEPAPLRPHVWINKALAERALGRAPAMRRIFAELSAKVPDFMADACRWTRCDFSRPAAKWSESEIKKTLEAALRSMRGNRSRWFYTYFTKGGDFRYARIYGLSRAQAPAQLQGQPWIFAD